MTNPRTWRLPRGLATVAVACLVLFGPGWAIAEPTGLALIIAVDRDAEVAGGGACGPVARHARDRLSEQGLIVQAVFNPSAVAIQSAIDSFAAQIEADPPGVALIYACGGAISAADRLFLMPYDPGSNGRVDPTRQGVVLQALLNALAGSGGTLYADLGLMEPAPTDVAVDEAGIRLPTGLHMALSLAGHDSAAPVGDRLASAMFRAGQGWDVTAAMMHTGSGSPDASVQTLLRPLPSPVSATPAPVSRPQEAGDDAPSGPAGATSPPTVARAPALIRPAPARSPPQRPSWTAARLRSADVARTTGETAGPAVAQPVSDRVKRLQTALVRIGYGGPIDGRLQEPTMEVIRKFQRRLGDPETGVLTQAELVRLLNH